MTCGEFITGLDTHPMWTTADVRIAMAKHYMSCAACCKHVAGLDYTPLTAEAEAAVERVAVLDAQLARVREMYDN